MSFHYEPLPGWLRLSMELENERARQYWLETQAALLEEGAGKEEFDAFAFAAENLWCDAAEQLKTENGRHALEDSLEAGTLTCDGLDSLSPVRKQQLLHDFALIFDRFAHGWRKNSRQQEGPAPFSELATVHASRAGITRYFQCCHYSKIRPSARTAMLLDPAINIGDFLDGEDSGDGHGLITFSENSLVIIEDDLEHVFSPVRVSAVRPRIFLDKMVPATPGRRGSAKYRNMTFAELGEQILADRPHLSALPTDHNTAGLTWSDSYQVHFAGFVKLLVKWFGTRPVASLEETDWRKFFAVLKQLPKTHHKSSFDADRTLGEITAAAARKVQMGKMAASKIGIGATATNRNVSFCRTLYSQLARHVATPEIHWSLFECPKPKPTRDRGYDLEEMKEIFRLPLFTGRSGPTGAIVVGKTVWHNASYWVLLLAHYSGARVGEICGLTTDDVKERDGICFIELRHNKLRSLKRTASIRDLPLHPELVRLGFLEFAEAIKESGEWRLFPELISEGRAVTSGYVELVGEYLKRLLSFMGEGDLCHPIRHFVSQELRLAEVPVDACEALMGHRGAEPLSERRESLPNLKRLQDAISRIPVLTAHLKRHPILLHPEELRARQTRPALKRNREALANQLKLRFPAEHR